MVITDSAPRSFVSSTKKPLIYSLRVTKHFCQWL